MVRLDGLIVGLALTLAGCATPGIDALEHSADDLYSARSTLPNARLPDGQPRDAAAAQVASLLAAPVTADGAVQIALLHNPRVQAFYAQLGLARGDLYDAVRLSNPTLGYVGLGGRGEGQRIDWSLSQNFTEILFLRLRRAGAESRVRIAEQRLARELLDLEADVRTVQVRYVGSRMISALRDRIAKDTAVAADYGRQLYDAGNVSRLQLARLREAADLASTAAVRAHAEETADRNALLTLLGLASDSPVEFAGDYAVPDGPAPVPADVSRWALANRLDLLSAREALRFAEVARTHARRWRWFGESSVGVASEHDGGFGAVPPETLVGPSASIALPLFNQGQGSVDRAHATVQALDADVRALTLSIENDVATRLAALAAARASIDLHRGALLPEQRIIVAESRKEQNFMLIGATDVLAAQAHQYAGYESYIQALRDYWTAYVALARATGGRFPGLVGPAAGARVDPTNELESPAGEPP